MRLLSHTILFSLLLSLLLFANLALAAVVKPASIPCVPNLPCINRTTQEKGGGEVRKYILSDFGGNFIKGFLGIAALTSVIFIIVGGMQMHLAMGNEEALTKAKKTLIWAIAGLVIAILSVAIVQIVARLRIT